MNTIDRVQPIDLPAVALDHRYATARELDDSFARLPGDWLSDRERLELCRWRDPGRRQCWLRARLLAKQLVCARQRDLELGEIEILSGAAMHRPRLHWNDLARLWPLSISHTDAGTLVAIDWSGEHSIGVDLTPLQELSAVFRRLWFTASERQWLGEQTDPWAPNKLWAIKESLYKACNRGEPFDPRQIEAIPRRCRYREASLSACDAQVSYVDGQLAAIVIVPILRDLEQFPKTSTNRTLS